MTAPAATFNLSATVSAASGPIAIGDVVVPIGGVYYKATPANLATAAQRAHGIATSAWSSTTTGSVSIQHVGVIDASVSGLSTGSASWVRVSTAGRLERVTPSGADDICGYASADGTVFVLFGLFTAAIVNGGGGSFTAPTGTGFVSVTGGALDAASIKVNLASTTYVTGTLPVGNGGTGITSLGSGVATWLGTPSGANLGAALTSALPVAKGGTGLTALTIPASALLVGTTDTQTLSGKTVSGPSFAASGFLSVGATVAAAGSIRLANTGGISVRDAANASDIVTVSSDASNRVTLGDPASDFVRVTPNGGDGGINIAGEFVFNVGSGQIIYLRTGGTDRFRVEGANLAAFAAGSFGGGSGVIFIANRTTAPTTNPVGGGVLYAEAGALKWRGSSGTVTTIAPA